ncbi:hypothetical protein WJX74_010992 [Apatococcus lobatus]|uniref:Mitotic spindle assembly checkpoint protein MAD1 n=1 Tax=Apatococcus lobatus TaxID=904363 RepID=A0AAW1S0Q3_9CHLO
MMLRTPPSSRKRARLLEVGTPSEDRAILPLPDEQEPQALAAYRHRSAQKDRELLAKLQSENATLSLRLQTAEASSREFEGLCTSANKHREALIQQNREHLEELETQLRKEIERSSSLLAQKRRLELEYDEVSHASFTNEERARCAEKQMDQQLTAWAVEKHALQQAVSDARQSQAAADDAVRQTQQDQAARRLELQQAHEQIKHAAQMCEKTEHKRVAAEKMVIILRKQLQDQAESPRTSVRSGSDKDDAENHITYLQSQLQAQEQLVQEAQHIKERHRNMLIIQEKLHSAQARAQRAEAEEVVHVGTMDEALSTIVLLAKAEAQSTSASAEQTALLASKEEQLLRAQQELKHLESALATTHTAAASARSLAEMSDRKTRMLMQDNASLTSLLASYDSEKQMSGSEDPSRDRIKQLESSQQNLQQHLAEIEAKWRSSSLSLQEEQVAMVKAQERSDKLAAAKQRLEQTIDDLQAQISSLERRLGRGELNTETTKVLHFIRNPEAELARQADQAKLEGLQAENDALRMQLSQEMKTEPGSGAESVAAATAKAQVVSLERKVAEMEKVRTRLQQVFASHISTFREACYLLFGYRVDFAAEAASVSTSGASTITLKPQRSTSKRAEFVFRMSKSKEITLLPNDFTRQHLSKEVQTFLFGYKSVPAFTANYTMDMHQKEAIC